MSVVLALVIGYAGIGGVLYGYLIADETISKLSAGLAAVLWPLSCLKAIGIRLGRKTDHGTHCPQGHPYAGDNVFIEGTARRCRICRRASARKAEAARPMRRRGGVR